eukprot:4410190-Amphidinium_carterae.1
MPPLFYCGAIWTGHSRSNTACSPPCPLPAESRSQTAVPIGVRRRVSRNVCFNPLHVLRGKSPTLLAWSQIHVLQAVGCLQLVQMKPRQSHHHRSWAGRSSCKQSVDTELASSSTLKVPT